MTSGTRLGPYEILAPLGAGGMGEVYRARDPRMGREVAIKLSAERFSDRFEREVRAVAALNHAARLFARRRMGDLLFRPEREPGSLGSVDQNRSGTPDHG